MPNPLVNRIDEMLPSELIARYHTAYQPSPRARTDKPSSDRMGIDRPDATAAHGAPLTPAKPEEPTPSRSVRFPEPKEKPQRDTASRILKEPKFAREVAWNLSQITTPTPGHVHLYREITGMDHPHVGAATGPTEPYKPAKPMHPPLKTPPKKASVSPPPGMSKDQFKALHKNLRSHLKSLTAKPVDESPIHESFGVGSWRKSGGKFGSLKAKGGAQWTPHVPKGFRERVEAMGASIRPSTSGGLTLVFEDVDAAESCFTTLMSEGIKVVKHDIPGILFIQQLISEAAMPHDPMHVALTRHTEVVTAKLANTADGMPLGPKYNEWKAAAIAHGAHYIGVRGFTPGKGATHLVAHIASEPDADRFAAKAAAFGEVGRGSKIGLLGERVGSFEIDEARLRVHLGGPAKKRDAALAHINNMVKRHGGHPVEIGNKHHVYRFKDRKSAEGFRTSLAYTAGHYQHRTGRIAENDFAAAQVAVKAREEAQLADLAKKHGRDYADKVRATWAAQKAKQADDDEFERQDSIRRAHAAARHRHASMTRGVREGYNAEESDRGASFLTTHYGRHQGLNANWSPRTWTVRGAAFPEKAGEEGHHIHDNEDGSFTICHSMSPHGEGENLSQDELASGSAETCHHVAGLVKDAVAQSKTHGHAFLVKRPGGEVGQDKADQFYVGQHALPSHTVIQTFTHGKVASHNGEDLHEDCTDGDMATCRELSGIALAASNAAVGVHPAAIGAVSTGRAAHKYATDKNIVSAEFYHDAAARGHDDAARTAKGDAGRETHKVAAAAHRAAAAAWRKHLKEDKIPGGKGDDKPDASFDAEQLEMGVKVEMEHTNDPAKAREIAKDHLSEDPHYYSKLKKAGLADELGESQIDEESIEGVPLTKPSYPKGLTKHEKHHYAYAYHGAMGDHTEEHDALRDAHYDLHHDHGFDISQGEKSGDKIAAKRRSEIYSAAGKQAKNDFKNKVQGKLAKWFDRPRDLDEASKRSHAFLAAYHGALSDHHADLSRGADDPKAAGKHAATARKHFELSVEHDRAHEEKTGQLAAAHPDYMRGRRAALKVSESSVSESPEEVQSIANGYRANHARGLGARLNIKHFRDKGETVLRVPRGYAKNMQKHFQKHGYGASRQPAPGNPHKVHLVVQHLDSDKEKPETSNTDFHRSVADRIRGVAMNAWWAARGTLRKTARKIGTTSKRLAGDVAHHVGNAIHSVRTGAAFESTVLAKLDAIIESPNEDFEQVFSDEEAAEDHAKARSAEDTENDSYAVIDRGDDTFLVIELSDALDRLAHEFDDDAVLHAVYTDGEERLDVDSLADTYFGDEEAAFADDNSLDGADINERHSLRSRLAGRRARMGLRRGQIARNRNNRKVKRLQMRRGSVYAAKKAVRSVLHTPR